MEDLALRRAGRDVLRGVRLAVARGEVHGLLGLSGSGKSSLAYALMGCAGYGPDQGVMRFDGRDLAGLTISQRARLGLTLAWQEPARIEGLTVEQYLAAGMRERREDRIKAALEAVGLLRARYTRLRGGSASGGKEKEKNEKAFLCCPCWLGDVYEPRSRLSLLRLPGVRGHKGASSKGVGVVQGAAPSRAGRGR